MSFLRCRFDFETKPVRWMLAVAFAVCMIESQIVGIAASQEPAKPARVVSADKRLPSFNAEAAKVLLAKGIKELVFIRRYTLNADHVYTEHLNSRWSPGGGLCVLDLKTGKVRDLVPKLDRGVVNRFNIDYDAQKLVFDFKEANNKGYRIYEVNLDGTGLRQLTFPPKNEASLVKRYHSKELDYHHGTDDMHPCYLPDGGIVFTTTRCQYSVLCHAMDVYTTKNLYRMDADGSNMRALTSSPVTEASPEVLPDGRIIYHRWEYLDKAAGNLKALWVMNPNGTSSAEIYGNTITFPETLTYPRPIPGTNGEIVLLGTSHYKNNAMGSVLVINTSDNIRSSKTMQFITKDVHALAHTGFHFRDSKGRWRHDKTGTQGRLFKDPYPISSDLFLAAHKPKGPTWDDPKAYNLVLLDRAGKETPLFTDPSISCWHPYPVIVRKRPPIISGSAIDPDLAKRDLARCLITDIYAGMERVPRGSVKHLRILEEVPRPWAAHKSWYTSDRDGMAHSAIGDGALGLKVQRGVVPVEKDGSAQFYVPARRNIYFQALDENYLALQTERTYVRYIPGETRSCVGCHEAPNQTQQLPRCVPLATLQKPSVPAPQPGETSADKLFDYDRQIQPIWNAHCTKCHNSKDIEGGLNLAGDAQGVYSVSYRSLVKLGKGKKQLLGNRRPRTENAGSANIGYLPPYSVGAITSPLAAMLSGGKIKLQNPGLQKYAEQLIASHPDISISDNELLVITNWLDVNCPFHPSYWGRLNAKFKAHPNYRPKITFPEALMRKVPKSILAAESSP